ncbi:hypothetical protein CRYUN_Cryun16bG0080700 [Craigia yunnanensis]
MNTLIWNGRGLGSPRVIYKLTKLVNTVGKDNEVLQWRFTGFYGNPGTSKRKQSCSLLKTLRDRPRLPWLCAGDFNEILAMDEKIGGKARHARQMDTFRDAVDFYGFQEIPITGH